MQICHGGKFNTGIQVVWPQQQKWRDGRERQSGMHQGAWAVSVGTPTSDSEGPLSRAEPPAEKFWDVGDQADGSLIWALDYKEDVGKGPNCPPATRVNCSVPPSWQYRTRTRAEPILRVGRTTRLCPTHPQSQAYHVPICNKYMEVGINRENAPNTVSGEMAAQ